MHGCGTVAIGLNDMRLPFIRATRSAPITGPFRNSLFLHIPKAAGMSLYRALENVYGADVSLRFPQSSEPFRQKFFAMPDSEIARCKLLSGHFDLPTFLERDMGGRMIFAVVREPVERMLSAYGFIRSWNQHPFHATIGKMSIQQYVEYQISYEWRQNVQCKTLCGCPDFRSAKEMISKNIHLLGAVELLGMFTRALGEALGVSLSVGRENTTPRDRWKRESLDPAAISKLQGANVEDYKLWTYVIDNNLVSGPPL
jgi:hypothetical protein